MDGNGAKSSEGRPAERSPLTFPQRAEPRRFRASAPHSSSQPSMQRFCQVSPIEQLRPRTSYRRRPRSRSASRAGSPVSVASITIPQSGSPCGRTVEGDIFNRSLSIDESSVFEGASRRDENPTEPRRESATGFSPSVGGRGPQKKTVQSPPLTPSTLPSVDAVVQEH